MGAATDYLENKILDHLFGRTTYTAPSTLYVGLASSVSDNGTITGEPSGNGYQRVSVTNNTTNFPNASGGAKTNGTDITFPVATGNWGTMSYAFIADSQTGGNVLVYGPLAVSKEVTSGDQVVINTGSLTISID